MVGINKTPNSEVGFKKHPFQRWPFKNTNLHQKTPVSTHHNDLLFSGSTLQRLPFLYFNILIIIIMSSTTSHSLPAPFAMDPVQDWAYAASWERPRALTCTPETYGGYDSSKTSYSVWTNRALSFTVSSRSESAPTGRRLDSVRNMFHAKDDSEGLEISRNMRLALVATDLVQP
jgi:hypothetical protein